MFEAMGADRMRRASYAAAGEDNQGARLGWRGYLDNWFSVCESASPADQTTVDHLYMDDAIATAGTAAAAAAGAAAAVARAAAAAAAAATAVAAAAVAVARADAAAAGLPACAAVMFGVVGEPEGVIPDKYSQNQLTLSVREAKAAIVLIPHFLREKREN